MLFSCHLFSFCLEFQNAQYIRVIVTSKNSLDADEEMRLQDRGVALWSKE